MSVLIVDDSTVMRRKIKRALESISIHDVVVAENGLQALEMFDKEQPELVTMDITMPEMDGVECIREIMKKNPDTLVLVVSALSDKSTTIEAMREGAKGFIQKPFDDQQLVDAILQMQADFSETRYA